MQASEFPSLNAEKTSRQLSAIFWAALKHHAPSISPDPYRKTLRSTIRKRVNYFLKRLAMRLIAITEKRDRRGYWYHACDTLALVSAHRNGLPEALTVLSRILDRQMRGDGYLTQSLSQPWQVMGGYALSYAAENCTDGERYRPALERLFDTIRRCEKAENGSIPYAAGTKEIYVDTIGMVCPFLAKYARVANNPEALAICRLQITEFFKHNVDSDTGLPFHTYYYPGPTKLGAHGWGRGVGWYLLGLVDVFSELEDDDLKRTIVSYISRLADTLRLFQKHSGNWSAIISLPSTKDDLSATAFCAYGLARAVQLNILDESYLPTLYKAFDAIAARTSSDGQVQGASAEAYGPGDYGHTFGSQPWSNGIAAAAAFELTGLIKLRPELGRVLN